MHLHLLKFSVIAFTFFLVWTLEQDTHITFPKCKLFTIVSQLKKEKKLRLGHVQNLTHPNPNVSGALLHWLQALSQNLSYHIINKFCPKQFRTTPSLTIESIKISHLLVRADEYGLDVSNVVSDLLSQAFLIFGHQRRNSLSCGQWGGFPPNYKPKPILQFYGPQNQECFKQRFIMVFFFCFLVNWS